MYKKDKFVRRTNEQTNAAPATIHGDQQQQYRHHSIWDGSTSACTPADVLTENVAAASRPTNRIWTHPSATSTSTYELHKLTSNNYCTPSCFYCRKIQIHTREKNREEKEQCNRGNIVQYHGSFFDRIVNNTLKNICINLKLRCPSPPVNLFNKASDGHAWKRSRGFFRLTLEYST